MSRRRLLSGSLFDDPGLALPTSGLEPSSEALEGSPDWALAIGSKASVSEKTASAPPRHGSADTDSTPSTEPAVSIRDTSREGTSGRKDNTKSARGRDRPTTGKKAWSKSTDKKVESVSTSWSTLSIGDLVLAPERTRRGGINGYWPALIMSVTPDSEHLVVTWRDEAAGTPSFQVLRNEIAVLAPSQAPD